LRGNNASRESAITISTLESTRSLWKSSATLIRIQHAKARRGKWTVSLKPNTGLRKSNLQGSVLYNSAVDPLSEVETRVLGALIEKDITTPDYYPLSLNALVNACNQKNNREPVMNLDENTVRQALNTLQGQNLAGPSGGADSRVTKYEHRNARGFQLQPW
jgi:hypothetical protein